LRKEKKDHEDELAKSKEDQRLYRELIDFMDKIAFDDGEMAKYKPYSRNDSTPDLRKMELLFQAFITHGVSTEKESLTKKFNLQLT